MPARPRGIAARLRAGAFAVLAALAPFAGPVGCAPADRATRAVPQGRDPIPPFHLTSEQKTGLLFPLLDRAPDPTRRRCVPPAGETPPHWLADVAESLQCTPEAREAALRSEDPRLAGDRLSAASACGDEDTVRQLLAGGADPNRHDSCGGTPLVAAAAAGQADTVIALLQAGAKPDLPTRQCRWTRTALAAAVVRNDSAIAEMLLDAKANPNVQTPDGRTALMFAAAGAEPSLAHELLRHRADPCRRDVNGMSAADVAESAGKAMQKLLEHAARRCAAARKAHR